MRSETRHSRGDGCQVTRAFGHSRGDGCQVTRAFGLSRSAGGGTCADVYPAETALFDDLELTTDPACPEQ